jgi:hypothetical protein
MSPKIKLSAEQRERYTDELNGINHAIALLNKRSRALEHNEIDGHAMRTLKTLRHRYAETLGIVAEDKTLL